MVIQRCIGRQDLEVRSGDIGAIFTPHYNNRTVLLLTKKNAFDTQSLEKSRTDRITRDLGQVVDTVED